MTDNPHDGQKNINEQLKAKIDEIDFDAKISQVTDAAHKAFEQIREQAAVLLSGNRSKVDDIIDKAATAFDEKTEGKYHDKVAKAKASFASGLDKISEDAPASGAATAADDASWDSDRTAGEVWAEATASESATDAADDFVAEVSYPQADHVGEEPEGPSDRA